MIFIDFKEIQDIHVYLYVSLIDVSKAEKCEKIYMFFKIEFFISISERNSIVHLNAKKEAIKLV